MIMTILLDTVTGVVMTSRVVLGFVLAGVVILIEAFVLYKLGWAAALTTSSDDMTQTTVSVHSPGKQFINCLRDSFLANFASTLLGWFIAQYLLLLYFWSISFWVTTFVISIAVEALMLWVLRRKSVGRSWVAAMAMNAASYLILVVLLGLTYELGLASRF
jgi:hypothetical protein